jgi:Zn-dependent peptidase ImmA (M78 family)/transcriptional regulator with XRE-family HTH domain
VNIPERLQYARERTGLTGPKVHELTGIGQSSLSEFENGRREPSLAQLQKLASAYRRSLSFFLEDGPIPQEQVLWREKPETAAADVEARFLRLCEQYHNLEVWTGEQVPVCLPQASRRGGRYGFPDAEALAKDVRDTLKLGDRPGLSLLTVLEEDCGVKVFHLEFEPTGTAASAKSDTFGAAILLNAANARWRRNFDLAHELFHLLAWDIFREPAADGATSSYATEEEEKLAQCFAVNVLMPSDAVRAALNRKVKDSGLPFEGLFDVARQFDVSVEALLWRMHNLHMLSENADETKALIERAKSLASVLEEREQTRPETWPERYKALAIKALRHGAISVGRFAEYLDTSRQKAMTYVGQGAAEDEAIPLTPA